MLAANQIAEARVNDEAPRPGGLGPGQCRGEDALDAQVIIGQPAFRLRSGEPRAPREKQEQGDAEAGIHRGESLSPMSDSRKPPPGVRDVNPPLNRGDRRPR